MNFNIMLLLAQQSDTDKWLEENPLVLGGLAILIGLSLAGYGVYELMTGVTKSKRGKIVEGGMGKMISIVRIIAGVGACLFGLYKIVV